MWHACVLLSILQTLLRAKDAEIAAVRSAAAAAANSSISTQALQTEVTQLQQLLESAAEAAQQQLQTQHAQHQQALQSLEAEVSQVMPCLLFGACKITLKPLSPFAMLTSEPLVKHTVKSEQHSVKSNFLPLSPPMQQYPILHACHSRAADSHSRTHVFTHGSLPLFCLFLTGHELHIREPDSCLPRPLLLAISVASVMTVTVSQAKSSAGYYQQLAQETATSLDEVKQSLAAAEEALHHAREEIKSATAAQRARQRGQLSVLREDEVAVGGGAAGVGAGGAASSADMAALQQQKQQLVQQLEHLQLKLAQIQVGRVYPVDFDKPQQRLVVLIVPMRIAAGESLIPGGDP